MLANTYEGLNLELVDGAMMKQRLGLGLDSSKRRPIKDNAGLEN